VSYDPPSWGHVEERALARLVVVSPHFDDAVMGVGHVLASHPGSVVVTVCGGRPPAYPDQPTPWDALGGFEPGDDVVEARRDEDRQAMAVLGAEPVWLEFSDHQYLSPEERPGPAQVAPALARALADADATAVMVPMGLGNHDHVMTHAACLEVRRERQDLTWFCYEDQGYKHIPGLLAWRIAKLFRAGLWPTPAIVPHQVDEERKRRALYAYKSQIAPLEQDHALRERLAHHVPEQCWALAPPPRGWERLMEDT
jgi:LmbE family N-acetylglucosaminyl deacetylase